MATTRTRTTPGLATVPDLDELIHQRVRLGIMSALAAAGRLSFSALRDTLDLTDGNLFVHARKLEEAGYVAGNRPSDDRSGRTEYALTDAGRAAFERYLAQMETLLGQVRSGG